ncbi:MAG: tRNA (guanosine(46)-N7)-methyltransferase TrmB [Actinomycetota bacterium]
MTDARSVARTSSTYKLRRRAMAPARQDRFVAWLERWGLDESGPPLDWTGVFGRRHDVVLDIGFGHGESVLDLARRVPATDVVGIEVHTPGAATVLDAIERDALENVRVVFGDGLRFLDRVPAESLAAVRVLFPDPWPKPRQHHRRMVAADTIAAFTDRLRVGGTLHLATDIADYAAAMRTAADGEPRLAGGPIDRSTADRPLTRFEQRGIDDGRTATDLLYERRLNSGNAI